MDNTALALISAERRRQVEQEGWSEQHDDAHVHDELAWAAVSYALPAVPDGPSRRVFWPWSSRWWKPTPQDRIRELVKAGALLIAEIERLQRTEARKVTDG